MIHRSNSVNLHPQRFDEISTLIQAQLMGGGQEDLVEVAALEALSPHQPRGTASSELVVGAGLMKDLVAWGFKNSGQAITLNDLSATVFASRSSIVHHCRQSFGTGRRAQLKQIRLSQVHHALSSPEVQQTIGGNSVHEIASHYGSQIRNHFAGITATSSVNPPAPCFNGHPLRG